MIETIEIFGTIFVVLGVLFLVAGTIGLLRFPDVYSRLHALTKADTLGLGLICLGLALQAGSLALALKYGLIWILMLMASSIGATLVAGTADAAGISPTLNPISRPDKEEHHR